MNPLGGSGAAPRCELERERTGDILFFVWVGGDGMLFIWKVDGVLYVGGREISLYGGYF